MTYLGLSLLTLDKFLDRQFCVGKGFVAVTARVLESDDLVHQSLGLCGHAVDCRWTSSRPGGR